MSLRLTKGLSDLTDIFSYLNLIFKYHDICRNFSVRALSAPMCLKYPGKSHLRPLPMHSLLVELGAALTSGSCPSSSFLSYAVGMLPSALPFRQRFANGSSTKSSTTQSSNLRATGMKSLIFI